ncbi:hypothetical protein ACL02T_25700 [Pseudonocardia sp. RS010]|uniref:hypothetical protein n=1 Tax=Pseudonocardia sp. RS010 TaxID=3385979 RepID=UPI0039A14957
MIVAVALHGTPAHIFSQVFGEWLLCYLAGRLLVGRGVDLRLIFRTAVFLAIFALFQLATGFNFAVLPPFNIVVGAANWTSLQVRADMVRAEVTLGHSIALGGILACGSAFLVFERDRVVRYIGFAIIWGGIFATASRGAVVAGAVVAVAMAISSRLSTAHKLIVVAVVSAAGYFVSLSFVDLIAVDAGAEASDSADYRAGLVGLFGYLNLFGVGDYARVAGGGGVYTWGRFQSIDNGYLFLGLYAGWLALALMSLVFMASLAVGIRRWGALEAASLGFATMLLFVAPITQFQCFGWMLLGLSAGIGPRGRRLDAVNGSRGWATLLPSGGGKGRVDLEGPA